MEKRQRLQELLEKKDWTAEEKQWLLDYLEQASSDELFALQQQDFYARLTSGQPVEPAVTARMLSAIHSQLDVPTKTSRVKRLFPVFWRRAIAAAIAGLLVTGGWYWLGSPDTPAVVKEGSAPTAPHRDVLPGGNKAVLTLADGSTIVLDDAQNGTLTQQGSMAVQKQEGKLIYNEASKTAATVRIPSGITAYNTIRTPRGGQYSIVLSDGSKVWLNAASSMRYPVVFSGPQRRVEIHGEAYLEVAHNAAQPFIVSVQTATGKTGEVEVLGTHFNINAYDDEERMQTTLLEGKVKVKTGGQQSEVGSRSPEVGSQRSEVRNQNFQTQASAVLKPGQQAIIKTQAAQSAAIQVQTVDVEQVVAWKNGLFEFDGNTLSSVMRQLSRWYDVEVVYEGPVPGDNFVGTISRQENLSKVLKMLELTKVVQFKIQEKNAAGEAAKIIVMQKK